MKKILNNITGYVRQPRRGQFCPCLKLFIKKDQCQMPFMRYQTWIKDFERKQVGVLERATLA